MVLTFSAADRAAIPSSPMAFSCKLRQGNPASAPAQAPRSRETGIKHRARCAKVPWGSLPRGAQDLPTCIHTYSRLARLLLDLSACASAVAAFA